MANETLATFKFGYDLFTGNTWLQGKLASRVYDTRPPQIDPDDPENREPGYPMLLLHTAHAIDRRRGGARRTFTEIDLTIKAVAWEQGAASLGGINSRVDALLNAIAPANVILTFEDLPEERYTILGAYRLSPLEFSDWHKGVRYDYLGGVYRVHVQRRS